MEGWPKDAFLPAYVKAVSEACRDEDDNWLGWLSYYAVKEKVLRDDFVDYKLFDQMMLYKNVWQ